MVGGYLTTTTRHPPKQPMPDIDHDDNDDDSEIFAVTTARGFLPVRDPLRRLPTQTVAPTSPPPLFDVLEALGDDLPKLLLCGNATLRQEIETRVNAAVATTLPLSLSSEVEERLLLLLSFISHAYVWGRSPSSPQHSSSSSAPSPSSHAEKSKESSNSISTSASATAAPPAAKELASTITATTRSTSTTTSTLHDCDSIPTPLADLWIEIARRRGRPPILTYSSFNLFNWRRIDKAGPVALGNIACLNNFLGGMDEEWFRCVHIHIEAESVGAVRAMLRYVEEREKLNSSNSTNSSTSSSTSSNSTSSSGSSSGTSSSGSSTPLLLSLLEEALSEITTCLSTIRAVLARMGEGCDPHIYYSRVRQYMSGWRNNPALPNGLLYGKGKERERGGGVRGGGEKGGEKGGGEEQRESAAARLRGRRQYYGETGAQSCILPAIDAFLGITHEMDSMREYLLEMREYVPRAHLAFLLRLEALHPPVREIVAQKEGEEVGRGGERGGKGGTVEREKGGVDVEFSSDQKRTLSTAYDQAVKALARFRALHLHAADTYIHKPAESLGTGGSDFRVYLRKHHRETKAQLLQLRGRGSDGGGTEEEDEDVGEMGVKV